MLPWLNNLHKFYLDAISMLDKMSLKLDSAYNICFWMFNSTHKRIEHNIRLKYNFHACFILFYTNDIL